MLQLLVVENHCVLVQILYHPCVLDIFSNTTNNTTNNNKVVKQSVFKQWWFDQLKNNKLHWLLCIDFTWVFLHESKRSSIHSRVFTLQICKFVHLFSIIYKKTDEWHIEWQRMTTSDNEWYNEWQQMAMSDSEWQQWYNEWKWHNALQRMDDCHPFNDKNRYTTTSRGGWLRLE